MHPHVSLHADDTDWGVPVASPGLLLDVPFEGRWRQRPFLHVEAAPRYRLRLMSGGQPLLWMRIDAGWEGCGFLRGPAPAPRCLPPLTAAEVRGVAPAPATPEWGAAWSHRFARELEGAEASLLHGGRWALRPLVPVPFAKAHRYPTVPTSGPGGVLDPPHSLEDAPRFEPYWMDPWDWSWAAEDSEDANMRSGAVLPLRALSPESDGRVKAWRKHARDGTLPPVLLLFFQLVGKWLVVDGHDRLQAALLEGLAPPLLGLWPFLEEALPDNAAWREAYIRDVDVGLRIRAKPADIDSANQKLLRAHQTHQPVPFTRAWPLRGGVAAWRRDVQAFRERAFSKDPESWAWFSGV